MKTCKLIMYHYVRPIKDSEYPEIKGLELKGFINQINYFKNSFNFTSSDQLLNCIYNNDEIKPNSIALTFDDGFKDHFKYVFPILNKEKIPALFFPSAKPIEENIVLTVHKIHFILANSKDKKILVNEIFELINHYKKE